MILAGLMMAIAVGVVIAIRVDNYFGWHILSEKCCEPGCDEYTEPYQLFCPKHNQID